MTTNLQATRALVAFGVGGERQALHDEWANSNTVLMENDYTFFKKKKKDGGAASATLRVGALCQLQGWILCLRRVANFAVMVASKRSKNLEPSAGWSTIQV